MSVEMGFPPTTFAWLAAALSALLFLAVVLRREFSRSDFAFLFLILCNLGWDIGYILSWPLMDHGAFPYRLMFASTCFLPGAFVHFIGHALESPARWRILVLYASGAIFAAYGWHAGITTTWKIALGIFIAIATALAFSMTWAAVRSEHAAIRFRARYLTVAVLAASLGGLADLAQGISGRLPATGALGSALALAILAVATARLEVVATHPLALDFSVFGGLSLIYAGIGVILHRSIDPVWALGITAVIVLTTIRPAAEAVMLFAKRVLLGIRLNEAAVLDGVRAIILSTRTEPDLIRRASDELTQAFGLTHATFSAERAKFSPAEIEALFRGPVTFSEPARLPEGGLLSDLKSGRRGAVLGFFRDGVFAGALLLSMKKNGRRFFEDELRLLDTIGQELTFACENMRLARREQLARLGEAIAMVSHEIKNPLTTLIGTAEMLRSGIHTPALKDLTARLASELQRLKHLVNEYLEYVRPFEPLRTRFDLAALAREVIRPMDGIRIESDGVVPVSADESAIRQVLLNLVQNAVESAGPAGVTISVVQLAEEVVLQVHDDGPGLDPSIRSRLFEPFATTKSGGTGLGLAICRQIVEAHGGTISLRDEPRGTTVEVRMPADRAC